jgi:hypothetical protein
MGTFMATNSWDNPWATKLKNHNKSCQKQFGAVIYIRHHIDVRLGTSIMSTRIDAWKIIITFMLPLYMHGD